MIGRDMPLPDFHTNRLLLDTVAGTKFGGTGGRFHGIGRVSYVATQTGNLSSPRGLNRKM